MIGAGMGCASGEGEEEGEGEHEGKERMKEGEKVMRMRRRGHAWKRFACCICTEYIRVYLVDGWMDVCTVCRLIKSTSPQ